MDHGEDKPQDAQGYAYGCMKLVVGTGKAKSRHIVFEWQEKGDRFECTVPYLHSSCYYSQLADGTEIIRFRGLNDEAMVKGYNLRQVKDTIDKQKLEGLRESSLSGFLGEGVQPIVSEIRVYDNE
jgi:hypothetical protein